jgi:putative endonuclease
LPRAPCVHILANRRQGTLYTGVTSNLAQRIFQHRDGMTPGFATRYGCNRLVFYETYERIDETIAREKQIKGGSRAKKIALIEMINPEWKDLYENLAELRRMDCFAFGSQWRETEPR